MLDVGLELVVLQPRLVDLQAQLQEADIGGIGQARAMLGVAAGKASLAEGRGEVIEATLRDPVDHGRDRRMVERFQQLAVDDVRGRFVRDQVEQGAETLARVGICVVCAGVKSILDLPATLERLETLNVTVLGYRTDTFPAFYLTSSGLPLTRRVETPADVAAVLVARERVGAPGAVVVANPLDEPMDAELHDRLLREGLEAAAEQGVTGRDVTPFLLERFHRLSEGESLRANVRLVLRNAALAAEIAAE